jgi:23S rRNA (guanosine2251-2'-O)-methyltransferase
VRGGVRPTGPRPNRFGSGSPAGAGAGRQPPWRQPQTEERWANPAPQLELVGPDEELVAGRRPVEEAFVAKRPARRLLVVPQRRQALERLVLHATSLRIPVVEVEGGSLTAVAGFDGHQGIALVVEPRTWASLDDILARSKERSEPPFVLVLDSLEDPQNLGTLLRSAEAAGVHGVLFPTHRQAPLTPAAVKASSGAVEHLLLAPVDDLPGALADLHVRGVRVLGSEADAPLTARQTDLRGPVAIVVGSEGQGLGPSVRRRCDATMRIPMVGAVGSLNAAVAGSILVFEAAVQRDPDGTRPRRVPEPPPAVTTTSGPRVADAAPDDEASIPSEVEPEGPTAAETVAEPASAGSDTPEGEPAAATESAAGPDVGSAPTRTRPATRAAEPKAATRKRAPRKSKSDGSSATNDAAGDATVASEAAAGDEPSEAGQGREADERGEAPDAAAAPADATPRDRAPAEQTASDADESDLLPGEPPG